MVASLAMSSRSRAPVPGRRRLARWIWAAALLLAMSRGAIAEPRARERAEALFAEGNAAIARNDAATAAERYRAAWELMPEARFVLNLGIALAELGRNAAAAEAIAIYLADPACDPAKRPVLEQRLSLWRAELGEIALELAPASAVVEIDGARPLRGAPGTRVPVTPGRHLVTARAAGHRAGELQLTVAARGTAVARIALPAASSEADPAIAARPAPPAAGTGSSGRALDDRADGASHAARPWKWIALGAAVAAAGAGSYFGISAIDAWHKVDDRCPSGVCTATADLDLAADARRDGTRANIAFGITGAALVAGFLLWRFEPADARSSISIVPSTSGGLLCISGAL
jgi:hypothetical protein